ncbi:MAG TPA: cyclase family protein [Thermomicrobiales bacterium]|nr:cyclase family protein [Thermomicrobiales bacterium]
MIAYNRIVDLTLPIVPGQGARPFKIEQGRTEELTEHVPVEHDWYIMHRVETISHIGTHIEAPYHCFPEGGDLGDIPLDRLVGEAAVLDLSGLPTDSMVGAAEMETVAEAAGGVRQGDIVFLRTGYADRQDEPAFEHRPSLTSAAMEWLVERGVKLVGTDLSGLEGPRTSEHLECHLVLLGNGIPFIENLTNLDQLASPRVFVCALPIPVHGLDAFPLRVVAFE